jgi:hypothetical protein
MYITTPKKITFLIFLSIFLHSVYSQETDSAKFDRHIAGAVTVTNNGISVIPTFTLGKPAAIFDLSVGGKKLSFEPQFRFALDGKPWSFIFWWRYKLVNNEKFRVQMGAHPAFLFKTVTATTDGVTNEIIQAARYFAVEFSPNYKVTKNISIGMYYLYGHALQKDGLQYSHFLTVNSNFSNIRLSKEIYLRFFPQLYYLKMEQDDGFYVTASATLAHRNFPLSVQSMVNLPIKTNIPGGDDIVWNVSLIYSFNHEYSRKQL